MKKRAGKPPIPPQAHDLVCIANKKIGDYLMKNKRDLKIPLSAI